MVLKLLSCLKVCSEGKVVDPWTLAEVHSLQDQGWILGDAVRIQMRSKRRKCEQTGISYFDWRNANEEMWVKRRCKKLIVQEDMVMLNFCGSKTFGEKHLTLFDTIMLVKWCEAESVLTVAARISWGQQARRKDLHTFGSLYFVPADSPAKIDKL